MHSAPAAARHRQRLEALCAATLRALARDPHLQVRASRLSRGAQPLPLLAPHLDLAGEHDLPTLRGIADGMALRLAHGDLALHQRLRPQGALARWLFTLLEQFRCEALAPPGMPGLVHNLRQRHAQWSLALHHGGLTDTATGLLAYAVVQVCRARVTGQPVVEETEGLIEATRMGLAAPLGDALAGLGRTRADQAAYAVHALAIANTVVAMARDALDADGEQQAASKDDQRDPQHHPLPPWLEDAGDDEATVASAEPAARASAAADGAYRVFTRAYDVQTQATALVRPQLLREHRERLDQQLAAQRLPVARLVRQLQALLAAPAPDGWDGAQDEGQIDGRALARLVASPTERRLFRQPRQAPRADAVVGFLIDCSGSMRQHVEPVALLVDVFTRALEQAGAATEVLGFTTGAWHGGRARRDWLRAGQPPQPGRLNELCHLVFKDAATPWRRARTGLAALLKADLFREGIDGEALHWACTRLAAVQARRRLLVVVSDGCPMDAATAQANGDAYLDQHLREVVARHEKHGPVELCAVGLGQDLSQHYRNTVALDLSQSVTPAVLRELVVLLARSRRTGPAHCG